MENKQTIFFMVYFGGFSMESVYCQQHCNMTPLQPKEEWKWNILGHFSNHDKLKLDLDLDFGAPQKINLKFYHNLQFQIVEQTGEPYAKIRK